MDRIPASDSGLPSQVTRISCELTSTRTSRTPGTLRPARSIVYAQEGHEAPFTSKTQVCVFSGPAVFLHKTNVPNTMLGRVAHGVAKGDPQDWGRALGAAPVPGSRMRVPARVFADETLLAAMDAGVFEQAADMAMLPGIVEAAYCMPDGHLGYGFPIGGMAAFDPDEGVISPGGIGFDINCGMRLVGTDLAVEEVRPRLRELVDALAARIPAGRGGHGPAAPDSRRAARGGCPGGPLVRESGPGLAGRPRTHRESGHCPRC